MGMTTGMIMGKKVCQTSTSTRIGPEYAKSIGETDLVFLLGYDLCKEKSVESFVCATLGR